MNDLVKSISEAYSLLKVKTQVVGKFETCQNIFKNLDLKPKIILTFRD